MDASNPPPAPSPWLLDESATFLNHGSFGACPLPVLAAQDAVRREWERSPLQFFVRSLEERLDEVRAVLSRHVGANPDELVFVPNATTGVNAIVRSMPVAAGDEWIVTDHAYGACVNALRHVAEERGARVVVAPVPFPLDDPQTVVDAVLRAVGPKSRLALIDHVTSSTGLVWPVEALARELAARGVEVLVDGAHGPGMVPLDLHALGVPYYAANAHKWLCAPKQAGFLYVRADKQASVHAPIVSHGR
jgi:isopenicillin-N epimerase